MKKLTFFLASFVLAGSTALAEEGTDFSTSAEYRLRYEFDSKMGMTDTATDASSATAQNAFLQRVKLDLNWKRGNTLSAKLGLLNNLKWGNRLEAGDPIDQVATHSGLGTTNAGGQV